MRCCSCQNTHTTHCRWASRSGVDWRSFSRLFSSLLRLLLEAKRQETQEQGLEQPPPDVYASIIEQLESEAITLDSLRKATKDAQTRHDAMQRDREYVHSLLLFLLGAFAFHCSLLQFNSWTNASNHTGCWCCYKGFPRCSKTIQAM